MYESTPLLAYRHVVVLQQSLNVRVEQTQAYGSFVLTGNNLCSEIQIDLRITVFVLQKTEVFTA